MNGRLSRGLKCVWQAWYPLLIYEGVTVGVVLWIMMYQCISGKASLLEIASGVSLLEGQELLCTMIAAAITAVLLLFLYRKTVSPVVKISYNRKRAICLVVLVGIAACLLFNYLFILVDFTSTSYQQTEAMLYAPGRMIQFAAIGVFAPLTEELVFRGFGFLRMRRICTFAQAAIFSSLCFGLFHGNIVQGVYGFCLGFILAWVFEIYHEIWAPVLLHMTANITSLLLTWLASGSEANAGRLPALAVILLSGLLMLIGIYKIREDIRT